MADDTKELMDLLNRLKSISPDSSGAASAAQGKGDSAVGNKTGASAPKPVGSVESEKKAQKAEVSLMTEEIYKKIEAVESDIKKKEEAIDLDMKKLDELVTALGEREKEISEREKEVAEKDKKLTTELEKLRRAKEELQKFVK